MLVWVELSEQKMGLVWERLVAMSVLVLLLLSGLVVVVKAVVSSLL